MTDTKRFHEAVYLSTTIINNRMTEDDGTNPQMLAELTANSALVLSEKAIRRLIEVGTEFGHVDRTLLALDQIADLQCTLKGYSYPNGRRRDNFEDITPQTHDTQ